jgi:hypothetical protein
MKSNNLKKKNEWEIIAFLVGVVVKREGGEWDIRGALEGNGRLRWQWMRYKAMNEGLCFVLSQEFQSRVFKGFFSLSGE